MGGSGLKVLKHNFEKQKRIYPTFLFLPVDQIFILVLRPHSLWYWCARSCHALFESKFTKNKDLNNKLS